MAILVSCTCLAVTTIDPVAPYAYGANVGWINFEQTHGQPQINLETGQLSGYAWGANVGWINLSLLATLTIDPGSSADGDNIPDAWELGHTNTNRFYRVRAEPPLSP